ncbi:BGP_1a_G0031850.mRNA.1.CDS.1 [Saccharomyces cerevisiae]|nr:BGP_1a_G0031850.mRNA.1.CDS.1 [Saccharomyces cerevisiae]CAI7163917.1 BGP_1a_G0031850.mRNA.1.CDS.1 [Saccharomyces cerevisiae]CAI7199965.1 ASN_collapsed_G0032490.mRNA.1.CDS.1 [Saccharomyces cerevisiae]
MPPLDKRIKKFLKDSIRIAPKISGKGELSELRTGLVSQYPQTRKDAIKKTIQQMTLGKDVSSLFPDVLKNIATIDVEQKKLVYLYVMNYAETHPELCILAVNTFITDAQDPNPLIRCMAIRTMSMIRVDKILEYIETPLRRTLHDDNAYVRKTAVICVAKLFQLNKDLCVELGVVEDLVNALDDSNPLVIANATAALIEIHNMDMDAVDLSSLIQSHVSQFLLALNECTEWARIIILGTLSEYSAKDSLEAQDIIDRVTAHLQHVNPAVVLATIKVIVRNLPQIEYSSNSLIMKRLSSAFVSLMSTPPEMQYVALKNIRIILEKYPELLTKELRIFYVKFNDPLYVKLEKIDILVRLVDPSNLKQCTLLLTELKEYAMEYEPEFVSRAIQALSQLGIKYAQESFVSKVLDILLELLERQDTIKDDCCISLCDLLRLCPGNDKMAKQVCAVFNTWSNPEVLLQSDIAKCNYVWLLGQHPNNFSDLESKINIFIENFVQEEALTQMSLLMTIVRLHATLTGSMLQSVLELATQQTHELDVRDMAMMYWRCLSMPNNESLVNDLCQNKLPMISNTLEKFSPEVLEKLLMELGTISSIYFKPDSNRRKGKKYVQNIVKGKHIEELESMAKNEISSKANDDVLLDFDERDDVTNTNAGMLNTSTTLGDLDDLFDFGPSEDATQINTNDTKAVQGLKELKLGGDSNGISSGGKNNPDVSGGNIVSQDLLDLF